MTRALPEHSAKILLKYSHKLFDACARLYRKKPFRGNQAMLMTASEVLLEASGLYDGAPHVLFMTVANHLNDAANHFNAHLRALDEPEFSFVSNKLRKRA